MSINIIKEHIEITPGICGGKPRIAGHRIRVQDIVIWHEQMGLPMKFSTFILALPYLIFMLLYHSIMIIERKLGNKLHNQRL
ncbi:DUF433 domain-containing protein [Trichormus azollae]|uniref:DUF433 domain-containing protein n=1 Tax=Trichormus azollae TaxID=1164 RepID=UPI00325EE061